MRDIPISFCTVCMNRLHHLKKTLPENIDNNSDYKNLEYVLLDYNSTDGLEEWIRFDMKKYVENGKLKYYKTTEPLHFHPSHSKNVAFKLANGEVLCNVDADNYTGTGFATFLNEEFNKDSNIFLTPINFHKIQQKYYAPSDAFGRICLTKKAFLSVRGYTEKMSTTGFQDYDLANRLELAGNRRILLENPEHLKAISHDDIERLNNEFRNQNLEGIYFSYLTPAESNIIFLYKNGNFERGRLIDNSIYKSNDYHYAFKERKYDYGFTLKQHKWVTGKWEIINTNKVKLFYKNGLVSYFSVNDINIGVPGKSKFCYYKLTDQPTIKHLIKFNTHYTNRTTMVDNWNKKKIITNKKAFGKAVVFRNFDNTVPLNL